MAHRDQNEHLHDVSEESEPMEDPDDHSSGAQRSRSRSSGRHSSLSIRGRNSDDTAPLVYPNSSTTTTPSPPTRPSYLPVPRRELVTTARNTARMKAKFPPTGFPDIRWGPPVNTRNTSYWEGESSRTPSRSPFYRSRRTSVKEDECRWIRQQFEQQQELLEEHSRQIDHLQARVNEMVWDIHQKDLYIQGELARMRAEMRQIKKEKKGFFSLMWDRVRGKK